MTSVIVTFGAIEVAAGWVRFAACWATIVYANEPGIRLTAPCIPGACWEGAGLVVVPLLPFFFLLLLF
jgi:hypothetical protein